MLNSDLHTAAPADDQTSDSLDITQFHTQRFCTDFPLRRHAFETEANAGCHEARMDWAKYIGSTDQFGGCNPVNGNFTALVLPLCKPERLRHVAYVLEYAFLYDNIIETDTADQNKKSSDSSVLSHDNCQPMNPALRRQQIQAKMILELTRTDKPCTERVMNVWKTMISTTLRDKDKHFSTLEEYVDFRIVDTGAPFVESMMLWGMGMPLTAEEDEALKDVVYPCYAALGLANDYFSFDREYAEMQSTGQPMTNSVWLCMQWHDVDIPTAKTMVREAATGYEKRFQKLSDQFRNENALMSKKLDRYLRGLTYQISGNVVWSLNCPRYHPDERYDANVGLEDRLTREARGEPLQHERNLDTSLPSRKSSLDSSVSDAHSFDSSVADRRSSATSCSTSPGLSSPQRTKTSRGVSLDLNTVQAPFKYIASMPSKGLRNTFIDALNIWFNAPAETLEQIKHITNLLHTASLMLDDIQDSSDLRRGKPSAHKVFGVPQTINSANLGMIHAIQAAQELQHPQAMQVVLEEIENLHVGQGYDLHWSRHASCPTEDEYLEMVSLKTGGLFRLPCRLMILFTPEQSDVKDEIESLITLIGQTFQIRDDYQNLASAEYTSQKGFCDDLDEGKFSFPLIHCLSSARSEVMEVTEMMRARMESGGMMHEMKSSLLERMREAGSLEYTKCVLTGMKERTEESIRRVERDVREENWVLRLFVEKLAV